MSKKKTIRKKSQTTPEKTMAPWLTHGLAILAFLVITTAYFYPQLEGKIIIQGDIVGWKGMAKEAMDHYEETGEIALWSNSMFGGMPTFQTNNLQPGNYMQHVLKAAGLFISRPIGVFLAGAVFSYIMLLIMGVRPLIAWLGGFAFAFATYNPILFEAGHTSKLLSIMTFPVIIAGMYLTFSRKYLLGGGVFAGGMAMALFANHVQMTYFLGLVLGFYFLAELIRLIKVKEWAHLGKSVGVLMIALLLGVGSSAGKLWTTYEYGKDTMRGEPILETSGPVTSSSETDGLAWDYAMQWSQGSLELMTLMIPGIVGGSSAENLGNESATYRSLSARGIALPAGFRVPLYWGELPFTSGPVYVGVLICLFFVLGLILEKGAFKWWILAAVILTLMYSMGKHFEGINRLLYDHLPLMNKFRSPNSITAVTPILMILLGAVNLKHIMAGAFKKEQVLKAIYIAGGILGGIALFYGLLGSSILSFSSPGDAQLEQSGFPMDAIRADRISMMRGDAFRAFFIVLAGSALLWLYVSKRFKAQYVLLALAAITVIDLWTVNKRYLSHDDFVEQKQLDDQFKPRPVDEQILSYTEEETYRVHDLTINTFNSSKASYFHHTIGGYHAAKLQRYQDMIDRHISRNNMAVLNMLNTRFFIVSPGQDQPPVVQQNPEALGNGWLVKGVRIAQSANEEIDALGEEGFDPESTAVVHKNFEDYLKDQSFSAEGSVQLTTYTPNRLTYEITANGDQFAVFSEVWYGPDKGWKVYLNGEEVDHIRVNYILRGMNIPDGQHEVVFSFEPRSHIVGEKVARASSGLILLFLIGLLVMEVMKRRRKNGV